MIWYFLAAAMLLSGPDNAPAFEAAKFLGILIGGLPMIVWGLWINGFFKK